MGLIGIIFLTHFQAIFALELVSENFSNYTRLNFLTDVDNKITVEKKGNQVFLTGDFSSVKDVLNSKKLDARFITNIKLHEDVSPNKLQIDLLDSSIDAFSFYQENETKLVVDFWKNKDLKQETPPKITQKEEPVRKIASTPLEEKKEFPLRDIRYGSPFEGKYPILFPSLSGVIDTDVVSPDYFYPIVDRDTKRSEREAHVQLNINFYRDKKWELLFKSISLYESKYETDENWTINEYIKACALIKQGVEKEDSSLTNMGHAILDKLASITKSEKLKMGIFKFLITNYYLGNDYINMLRYTKLMYAESEDNKDYKRFSLASMFFALSKLQQLDTLNDLLNDENVTTIMSPQEVYGHRLAILLNRGELEDVVRLYQRNKVGMVGPADAVIYYNLGQAYFRLHKYDEAIKFLDLFAQHYSEHTYISYAYLQLAIAYELLNKEYGKVVALYTHAINHSTVKAVSYEAGIRLVAYTNLRNFNPKIQEKEYRVFLENSEEIKYEIDVLKLLWLTRLRLFIVDGKYQDALNYLNAVPLGNLPMVEQQVFLEDGSEVILGLLIERYRAKKFSELVQIYEQFKDRYIEKMANSPIVNYLVANSYIQLGLFDNLGIYIAKLEQMRNLPSKNYPIWIARDQELDINILIEELKVVRSIKIGAFDEAIDLIKKLPKKSNKINYFKGVVYHHKKDYKRAVKSFENYFIDKNSKFSDSIDYLELVNLYVDSLYQTKNFEQLLKVGTALLVDIKDDSEYATSLKEQITYLVLESAAINPSKLDESTWSKLFSDFKEKFSKSQHLGRVKYLEALHLLQLGETQKGEAILIEIRNSNEFPSNIKDLAVSELSLLRIKRNVQ